MDNLKRWFRFVFDALSHPRAGIAIISVLPLLTRTFRQKMIRPLSIGLALYVFTPVVMSAAAVTQGFHTDKPLEVGTVVSVKADKGTDVEKTTVENDERLVGVIVDAGDAVIDLQSPGTDVRVGISGDVSILVSDLGGTVKKGDYLIASPLAGIAMKDNHEAESLRYIAIANEDFNPESTGVKLTQIEQKDGSTEEVWVGAVSAKLLLGNRTVTKPGTNVIKGIAQRIAGKPVGNAQVIAAAAVFITAFSLSGVLLNGSVRGSFISLGRNPLSKHTVIGSLFAIVSLSTVVLAAGIGIAYAVLQI